MLAQYRADTQNLLNDQGTQFFPLPTIDSYINRSRRRIAAASGCLRTVPPGVMTVPNQEVYPFANWDSLVQTALPGVQSILAIGGLSIAIGGKWQQQPDGTWIIAGGAWKPSWRRIVWSDFQARFRIYGRTFYGVLSEPGWYSQFGEGPIASVYIAPIPSQAMPMEVDLICIPQDLITDDDDEIIPYPWSDAVSYWAATLALLQQQRMQDAQVMAQTFNAELPMCASVVCPRMIQNVYGATMRSA